MESPGIHLVVQLVSDREKLCHCDKGAKPKGSYTVRNSGEKDEKSAYRRCAAVGNKDDAE